MAKITAVHRFNWWQILVVLLIGCGMILGTHYDQGLYHDPIVQVTAVRNAAPVKQTDTFNNQDQTVNQSLSGQVLNGHYRGETVHFDNTYSSSGAMDRPYHVGNQLFVVMHRQGSGLNVTVKDMKRDTQIVTLAWVVVGLLVLMLQTSGWMAFLSVAANGVLFTLAVTLNGNTQGTAVLAIFGSLAVIFSALTLWLVLGWTRQMVVTLAATLGGTLMAIVIAVVVFQVTHNRGLFYESMQYVTQLPQPLFLAECLLGSLGAVMDESTDIIASLAALAREQPDISNQQLFQSGRQIGSAIMGPLINVLFFIFVADTLPLTLLYLKNGNTWGYTFAMNMSLGVVQSLISGIGIVLAVPLASYLASHFLRKGAGVNERH